MPDYSRYIRPDHRVSPTRPITIKVDRYEKPGIGQSDMHYDVELGIVLAGCHRRWHADHEADFAAGDFWLCGIWEPHRTEILQAPLNIVMFHIYPPFLAQLQFPEAPHVNWLRCFSVSPETRPRNTSHHHTWQAFAQRMVHLSEPKGWEGHIRQRLLLQELLLEITSRYGMSQPISPEPSLYSSLTPAIDAVLHTGEYVSVEHAAHLCHLSRRLFSERFKHITGVSFSRFALRHRLAGAAQDLLNPDMAIKAVASRWGFTDSSHFHRHFSIHYGCGPDQWRKNQ